MKKYLMFAAAALAFASCSKMDGVTTQSEITKAKYDYAFKNYIGGEPAPDQTWGFSDDAYTRSGADVTRANPGTDVYPATHSYKDANGNVIAGANMNHNEWADPQKEFGGWIVPDALTDGQKLRVQKYFQANPNLDYEDPHYRHFFVQQVYKGAEDPGANSTEVVTAADGSKYTSKNMNHLTVGEASSHINDFNAGTCSTSNVLDNGQSVGGTSHSDQITLMVNVYDTSCFGYHDSGSSNQSSASPNHNDKMALVSAATIDAWAAANGNPGEAVVDKWNRSFMGFDLAIKEGEQAYERDNSGNIIYATYSQAAESPKFAWDGENIIEIAEQSEATGWQVVYKEGYKTIQNIGWLTTNKNFYIAADQVTMSQTISMNRAQASTITTIQNAPVLKDIMVGDTYYQSVINLPRIKQLVDAGYLPVNNKSLAEWVKVGTSDGYFSDWIVTLTEAKRISDEPGDEPGDDPTPPTPPTPSVDPNTIRIIAEDLSAEGASDFDFNDVVLDVTYGNPAKVVLTHAGGVLPLCIRVNGNHDESLEVHKLFGQWVGDENETISVNTAKQKMINTGAGPSVNPVDISDMLNVNINSAAEANQKLQLWVFKEGSWQQMEAPQGEPACKLAVDENFVVLPERTSIKGTYPLFVTWATTTGFKSKWWTNK